MNLRFVVSEKKESLVQGQQTSRAAVTITLVADLSHEATAAYFRTQSRSVLQLVDVDPQAVSSLVAGSPLNVELANPPAISQPDA